MTRTGNPPPSWQKLNLSGWNVSADGTYTYDVVITYTHEVDGTIVRGTARFNQQSRSPLSKDVVLSDAIDKLSRGDSPYPRDGLPANYAIDYDRLYILSVHYAS